VKDMKKISVKRSRRSILGYVTYVGSSWPGGPHLSPDMSRGQNMQLWGINAIMSQLGAVC
jgi:hypothetical protein